MVQLLFFNTLYLKQLSQVLIYSNPQKFDLLTLRASETKMTEATLKN